MEILWTIVAFAIVGGGAALAGYILYKWMGVARHSHLTWP